jgi:hypothetical protein
MKKILKWLGVIIGIILLLSLFGGSKKSDSLSSKPETATTPKTVITKNNSGVFVALDADPSSYRKIAKESGINFIHRAPTWNSLEPEVAKYDFSDVVTFANLAKEQKAKLNLVFRPIDTGVRSMIEPYKSMSFDDPRMSKAILAMFTAMPQEVKSEIAVLTIGNEIDQYFQGHPNEIEKYAKLLQNIIPELRKQIPGALIAVNTTFAGNPFTKSKMDSIINLTDVYSLTYYHLNPDFTVKDPSEGGSVINAMVKSAGNKKLVIQELGMPTSEVNGSSEEKQAQFIHSAFKAVRENKKNIYSVTYLWKNDLPQSTVDFLASYYNTSDKRFAEFLGSMGLFHRDGTPKKGWEAFKEEVLLTTGR